MYYFYGWGTAIVLVQIACIVHAVRTGRSSWIWVILVFPLLGSIAYAVSEIRLGRAGHRLAGQIADVVAPSRRIDELRARLDECPTVENRMALASEYTRHRRYADAIALYRECLTGVHADDPEAHKGLATAQLESGAFADAKATLDHLFSVSRDRTPATRLLYARAVEGLGDPDATLAAYEEARAGAVGDEVRARHALALEKLGKASAAREIWTRIVKESQRADGRYLRDNREWIRTAKQRLDDARRPRTP
jgi:hypothetical protein